MRSVVVGPPGGALGMARRLCVTAAAVAGILAGSVTVVQAAGARRGSETWRAPERLADTGLYSDFASRAIDPRNIHYSPQYPLWSDGARKDRWIFIPSGMAIDASDPDVWKFPVGTKIWKEFAWSRRVETRYLERTSRGWMYAAYRWRDDESDAVLAGGDGALTSYAVAPGKRHAIPSVADCKNCHRGGRAEILGFSALQLSPDRDPLAPNREQLAPDMATLTTLVERGLVRGLPRGLVEHPPRIDAPTARGRAALGYLHANCGICHDSVGPLASVGVDLYQSLRARGARNGEGTIANLVDRHATFQLPGTPGAKSVWIRPGSPAASAVPVRMASRSAVMQMPPLGTAVPDEQALELIREWISQDLRSP